MSDKDKKTGASRSLHELVGCPFCGSQPDFFKPNRGYGMLIGCSGCHAQMFGIDEDEVLNEEAQKVAVSNAWNKRHSNRGIDGNFPPINQPT